MCNAVNAQQDSLDNAPVAGRKRVGVVLSGGGAKGMAHIGVLKVLEKAGIPIDIITGTSIGSIVGGLYSIGYNAHALDSLVRMQDWTYLIADKEDIQSQSLTDRKKQYTYLYSTGRVFGEPDNDAGGFIKGRNLAQLFQRVCVGYTDSLDFSRDLPIPFACVATDIMTNTEVVFHSGRLPQAMRASMAIPAAFTPVRMGDKVLVDGCLRNNYPADVARDMGAEILIGITLSGKPKEASEVTGTMSVIGQILDVTFENKYEDNIAMTDLYMNVDPHSYSTASFSSEAIDSLIRYGEEEAMRHWDEIIALKKRIGIDDSFKPIILQPLRPEVLSEKRKVTRFEFQNMTPQAERFLIQKFHLDEVKTIDAKLEQQLTSSMRVDLFYHTAECRLLPEDDGVRVILMAGALKSVQLQAGVRFDLEEYVALLLGLEIPLKTSTPVNADITLRLGKRIMGRAAITAHPRNFTRPTFSFTFFRNDMDIYYKGERDYNILFNHFQTDFFPINFDWRHFNLKMGLRWDYMNYRSQLAGGEFEEVDLKDEHFISYRASADFNSEDNWYFPTRGSRFKAEYAYVTDNFTQMSDNIGMSEVSANWRTSIPFSDTFTLQPMIYGRLLFGTDLPIVLGNTIGGSWFGHYMQQQMPFAGIGYMEYINKNFVAVQMRAQQRFGKNNYVLFTLTGGQQAPSLNELFDYGTLIGTQLAYYYNTIAGPVGGSLGYSNRTREVYFTVNLGYEF